MVRFLEVPGTDSNQHARRHSRLRLRVTNLLIRRAKLEKLVPQPKKPHPYFVELGQMKSVRGMSVWTMAW